MPSPLALRLRLVLGPDVAVGPGKADLLERIAETGSIAAAGRHMGMSYRRAWLLVDAMNRCFSLMLLISTRRLLVAASIFRRRSSISAILLVPPRG